MAFFSSLLGLTLEASPFASRAIDVPPALGPDR